MPPLQIIDLSKIDINNTIYGVQEIESINPHRFEMRHLDGIVHLDKDNGEIVGFKDVTDDEFWVRGHIPGRPLFPGVIMIEASAQLASFCAKHMTDPEDKRFFGFAGIQDVKFRNQVVPGDKLYLLGKFIELKPRRFKCQCQGFVNDKMAFQATIVGMPI